VESNIFRALPSVNDVLQTPILRDAITRYGHDRVAELVRGDLDERRRQLSSGQTELDGLSAAAIALTLSERLMREGGPRLRTVINATGIVLHTNLGRAPMASEAADAAKQAALNYVNLELDLETGNRSSRHDIVRDVLCRLTGAESAVLVNNNAAATVITLRAVAQGKEVVISRGQLIEIGGSFRIPEIMAVSGAILKEVGTTNITRLADYERAITPQTGALMRVHPSNYRVAGFTESTSLADLVSLGQRHRLPVIDDIGSGALVDFTSHGLEDEPVARRSIQAGADLVLFSGDKLLGGAQAGVIVGRRTFVDRIAKDPLMRAFRVDKMTLAALAATLAIFERGGAALNEIPILRMIREYPDRLRARAENLSRRLSALAGLKTAVQEDHAFVGGGSLPDQRLRAWVVSVETAMSADELTRRLRTGAPAVLARIREGKVLFDPRTVFEHQEEELVAAVSKAMECGK
jgi:L-seryl-tRNA(Ser) seleniumtransferase